MCEKTVTPIIDVEELMLRTIDERRLDQEGRDHLSTAEIIEAELREQSEIDRSGEIRYFPYFYDDELVLTERTFKRHPLDRLFSKPSQHHCCGAEGRRSFA